MSLMAGIFSRRNGVSPRDSACESLKALLSRNPEDKPIVFRDDKCFLAKIDVGAYGEQAFRVDPSGSVSMLAGEPLLDQDGRGSHHSRTKDLEALHESWDREDWALLKDTRGVFSAVHYQPRFGRLRLLTDKLGVRPIYYWASDDFVFFASALRILEGLSEVPKQMDLRAVTEIAALGYPLGDRTPYCNIIRLKAGELVEVSDQSVARSHYWRWDNISVSSHSEEELLRDVYETFTDAVARRVRADKITVGTLSGGMDSRCLVAALRHKDVSVHTFNFSPEGSQDRAYGAAFARAAGTIHSEDDSLGETRLQNVEPGALFTVTLARTLRSYKAREHWPPERPQLVWSGDGGSVGLGFVYLSRGVTDLLQVGDRTGAIDVYLKEYGACVLVRLLKSEITNSLGSILITGILEELSDIRCEDMVRAFYIFLLLNDQRRHLSGHFEMIDLHRLEFQTPFYDGRLLQAIMRVPIDLCLRHQFYTKLLAQFQPVVRSVPWQTYPGHEPCPIPVPQALKYQWHSWARRDLLNLLKPKLLQDCSKLLQSDNFPSPILNKGYLRMANWIFRMGLRDYGYVIDVAKTYNKYWVRCAGNYKRPSTVPLRGAC